MFKNNTIGQMACDTQTAHQRLEKAGVRPSLQRSAVLEWLTAHRIHPTADDIHAALSLNMPTLSKTTVYNTLKTLEENGLVQSLHLESEKVHFDADISQHAHFFCRECNRIEDIVLDDELCRKLKENSPEGCEHYEINFYGLCHHCRKD